jgi:hypothetical protein
MRETSTVRMTPGDDGVLIVRFGTTSMKPVASTG